MKKLFVGIICLLLAVSLTACGNSSESDEKTLTVAATSKPHGDILEEAKSILKDEYDIDLKIEILDDYYIFNRSLNNGDVDANFFQHVPFFEKDVKDNGYDLVNVGGVHIEPFGFYSKQIKDIGELKENDVIVISNSVADHGRILAILDDAGVIELDDKVKVQDATIEDIKSNPLNLEFKEIKPEILTNAYENNEGALVAINGNYAIDAGLNPIKDAVLLESANEDNPYVNIVACQKGHENDEKIKALIEVLQSDKIKDYITSTYSDGSVIPVK